MGQAETLIGARIDRRVMTWLLVAVLAVMPLEVIGYDHPAVTNTLPIRMTTLLALLVAVRVRRIGPLVAGRLFLTQAITTLVLLSILVETSPERAALEGVAYGTILPIFTLLIAPLPTRRRWSAVITLVALIPTFVRLLPDHPSKVTQVVAVLVVHGAALAMLDLHAGRAERVGAMAGLDPLTGLSNRRESLTRLVARLERVDTGAPAALIMLDLDHFKIVNDTLGHEAGDEALCEVASLLRSVLRPGDNVCRWGGEEFMIMLPDADEQEALATAERLRQTIAATAVTASFGVAEMFHGDTAAAWVRRADEAMYAAKRSGRNCVVASSDVVVVEHDVAAEPGALPPDHADTSTAGRSGSGPT